MPVLIVEFENSVLQKVPINGGPITIGRAPDNSITIDNLAVSNHHAQIEVEQGQLVVQDLNSLNGTFVNSQRVKRGTLKDGDVVLVGKHSIYIDETGRGEPLGCAAIGSSRASSEATGIDETFVLDTKKRREMIQEIAAAGERSQLAPKRVKIATLARVTGNIDQLEYPLTAKLNVIGKSDMATIRLRGWFKPKLAAQINRREDGYYISQSERVPTVNGQPIVGPTLLSDGDLIDVCGVQLKFLIRD